MAHVGLSKKSPKHLLKSRSCRSCQTGTVTKRKGTGTLFFMENVRYIKAMSRLQGLGFRV